MREVVGSNPGTCCKKRKDIQDDGKTCKKMERHGGRWKDMEEDGKTWRKTERHGGRRKDIGDNGKT